MAASVKMPPKSMPPCLYVSVRLFMYMRAHACRHKGSGGHRHTWLLVLSVSAFVHATQNPYTHKREK
jgi:hypothetical protein